MAFNHELFDTLHAVKDDFDTATRRDLDEAFMRFALAKTNYNAARILRCAMAASEGDIITDQQRDDALFDVIEYLEQ
jgi:hypothetical protein